MNRGRYFSIMTNSIPNQVVAHASQYSSSSLEVLWLCTTTEGCIIIFNHCYFHGIKLNKWNCAIPFLLTVWKSFSLFPLNVLITQDGIVVSTLWKIKLCADCTINNKHTVSIAEAIHVPYRLQQISKRHNSKKNTWKDTKVRNFLYYVNIPQIWCQYLARPQRKVRKTKFKQKKISGVQSGQTQ